MYSGLAGSIPNCRFAQKLIVGLVEAPELVKNGWVNVPGVGMPGNLL